MSEPASITSDTQQGVLVLTVTAVQVRGDALAEALRVQMLEAVEAAKAKKVAVDMQQVEMITTVAFRPLLSLRRRLHENGDGRLMLCGLQPMVAEVFRVTRLISTGGSATAPFEVHPDVASAVAALQRS